MSTRFSGSATCRLLAIALAACLLLAWTGGQARADPLVTFLYGYVGGKALDAFVDQATGKPDIYRLRQELDAFIRLYPQHALEIAELRNALHSRMTRQDVEQLITARLARLDLEIAALAQRIRSQQEDLQRHAEILNRLQSDVRGVESSLGVQQVRMSRQESTVRALQSELTGWREIYTTMSSPEQAIRLGVEGMRALRLRNAKEAIRVFQAAHGFDRTDPGHLYGLALGYRREGKIEIAELMLASAVSAERYRSLEPWFIQTMERVQGPERQWLEARRKDPIYGVFVPGVVRAAQ
jgi:hypothetical protein